MSTIREMLQPINREDVFGCTVFATFTWSKEQTKLDKVNRDYITRAQFSGIYRAYDAADKMWQFGTVDDILFYQVNRVRKLFPHAQISCTIYVI